MNVTEGKKVPIKIWTHEVEDQAYLQLQNVSGMPYVFHHVAAMPDVHAGWGSTIGSVIASKGAISPATVGVDIGCGMLAVDLKKPIDSFGDLKKIRGKIESVVPVGFKSLRDGVVSELWLQTSDRIKGVFNNAAHQLGTLGGGNHFVEICDDGTGNAWLMLHSGSRGIGNRTARIHIDKAKELMKIWMIDIADPDLSYLAENSQEFKDYMHDLNWCQEYAFENRDHMMKNILRALELPEELGKDRITCHHNYVSTENHFGSNVLITRKGAIRAREGDMGIIPGSMGQKSYIVKGKGNADSFCSCSHGAGRAMSRTKAKATFTVKDLIKQTEGVECRKDEGILDEIPSAYKDIDVVMENQKDLVEIVTTLKAVICVKG